MSDTDTDRDGTVAMTVSTELSNAGALAKVEQTTQLDERNVGVTIGSGIEPPYQPETLASFVELNGTHARAIGVKARWEVGFGFDVVPHPSVDDPSEEQKEVVEDFWYGRDSAWKIGPEGTAAATPDEVHSLLRRDYHGVGWLSGEILTDGAGDPTGLAHVPAITTRVRKAERNGETVAGTGYVQKQDAETRYFGEAGDRHGDDPTFVDSETGDVYDSGSRVPNTVANELLFAVNPSPLSLYYGIPDWVAEIQTMALDEAVTAYNADLFEHRMVPYMAVVVKNGHLPESSRRDLRAMIHGLKGENHRTVILEVEKLTENQDWQTEGGEPAEIELQPLGMNQKEDMAFAEMREMNDHAVGRVHGVPPILLNRTETSNRSNSQSQIQAFANQEIAPEQSSFAERLYRILHVAYLDCPDWTIEFTLRGAENELQQAEIAATKLKAAPGVVKVNEAREWYGLEPLEDDIGEFMVSEVGGSGGGLASALDDELESRIGDAESTLREEFVTEHLMDQGASAD